MKFALRGVGSGSTVKPEPLLQLAQKAETLGYESVWIPEHLGVHRLIAFAPGFVPRSRFESDLFPSLERFADEVMARL